jgi:tetrahydromethanopterin S-methyltransferase subunit G
MVSFIASIKDNEFVKLASDLNSAVGFAKSIFDLFQKDPLQEVIDRLNAIQEQLQSGFDEMGQLIRTQIQDVEDVIESEVLIEVRAQTRTAASELIFFRKSGVESHVSEATSLSGQAIGRLIGRTDPFFLGGLVMAGNVRIDAIRAADPDYRNEPSFRNEILEFSNTLERMTNLVRQRVEASHIVKEFQQTQGNPHFPDTIRSRAGFNHLQNNKVVDSFIFDSDFPNDHIDALDPNIAQAHADEDRNRGVNEELNALQIPNFEVLIITWRQLAT